MSNVANTGSAERIKLERSKRAWTQEVLAEKSRLSVRTIQRLEGGEAPAGETWRALAMAFGIPVEELRAAARRNFGAPWSNTVKIITLVAVLIIVGAAVTTAERIPVLSHCLAAVLLATAVFSVRGYSVSDGSLLVHRMGWSSRFPLAELSEIRIDPNATNGSLRIFGSGGLFGFIGLFSNNTLGRYRIYSTATERNVVMRFRTKTIVVSPDSPAAFESAVREELATMGEQRSSSTVPLRVER